MGCHDPSLTFVLGRVWGAPAQESTGLWQEGEACVEQQDKELGGC